MDRSAYDRFFELELRHFWRIGKRRLVHEWMEHYAVKPGGRSGTLRILDIGGACSIIPKELEQFGPVRVIESDHDTVEFARERLKLDIHEAVFPQQVSADEQYEVVTMFDVLEHIEDDVDALRAVHRLLADGGLFMCTVPALMSLWSDHDVVLHHYRRYTRKQLQTMLTGAGFRVERITYYTGLLLPVLALQRAAGRLKGAVTGKHKTEYDVKVPPGPLNALFGVTMSVERWLLRGSNVWLGSSLIAVARKAGTNPAA